MTRSRVTLVSVTIGQVTVLTIAVVVGWLAVAPGGQTLAPNQAAHEASPAPQSVNTLVRIGRRPVTRRFGAGCLHDLAKRLRDPCAAPGEQCLRPLASRRLAFLRQR